MSAEIEVLLGVRPTTDANSGEILWDATFAAAPDLQKQQELMKRMERLTEEKELCRISSESQHREQETAHKFLQEVEADGKSVRDNILWAHFQASALGLAKDLTNEICPLCQLAEPNWRDVESRLATALHKRSLKEKFEVCKKYFHYLTQQLRSYEEDLLRAAKVNASRQEILQTYEDFMRCRHLAEAISNKLDSQSFLGFQPGEVQLYHDSRRIAGQSYKRLRQKIETDFSSLQGQLKQSEFLKWQKAHSLKEISIKTIQLQRLRSDYAAKDRKYRSLKTLVAQVQEFYARVDEAEGELSVNVLSALETSAGEIFQEISGNNALELKLKISTYRGIRQAEFEISDFYGLGPVSARDFLSEANRNGLGLSIYLASILNDPSKRTLLLMDDVTHSADDRHRRGLANFIKDKLAPHMQLIILTHDGNWYERLKEELGAKCDPKRILAWHPDVNTMKDDSWVSLIDQACIEIGNQNRSGGGTLRQSMECFLDKICERYRVKVPFNADPTKIKFEVKRTALVATIDELWKNGKGVIDPSKGLSAVAISQRLANLASHNATCQSYDQGDLEDARDDVLKWIDVFKCKNPHGGAGNCGNLLTQLQKIGNSAPNCSHCKKPFLP